MSFPFAVCCATCRSSLQPQVSPQRPSALSDSAGETSLCCFPPCCRSCPPGDKAQRLLHMPRTALSTLPGSSVWLFCSCCWLGIHRRVHTWKKERGSRGPPPAHQNKRHFIHHCLKAITEGHQHRKRCQCCSKHKIKIWHQHGRLYSRPRNCFSFNPNPSPEHVGRNLLQGDIHHLEIPCPRNCGFATPGHDATGLPWNASNTPQTQVSCLFSLTLLLPLGSTGSLWFSLPSSAGVSLPSPCTLLSGSLFFQEAG